MTFHNTGLSYEYAHCSANTGGMRGPTKGAPYFTQDNKCCVVKGILEMRVQSNSGYMVADSGLQDIRQLTPDYKIYSS